MVTACSDLEEEVGPMHVEEEVELTIQLHVPDMQASTRAQMVITENISSIVAIAFDESDALIKKVDAILSNQNHENHSGTLKIKVPKRTRTIHFLGNYTKESIASITSLETLNSLTTNDVTTMHYWGKAEYNGGNNLSVTLYRNMAKLTLTKSENLNGSCYIAGFVNRNLSGTIVPGGHAVGDSPTIPNNVGKGSYEADNSLGNVYYLFEHVNDKNNSPLYVIIEVKAKYYKVAFAAGDTYFPILRNRAYEITVDGIDEMYAENNYTDAVNSQYPINDLVITSVPMTVSASPTEVLNQSGQTSTVTVTIPEGITELNAPTHDAFTIAPPNGLTAQNRKYIVTPGNNYAFTFTVKEGVQAGDKTISFSGRGKYLKATGSANITLVDEEEPEKEIVTIVANPSATTLNYAANSVEDLLVNVTIPKKVTGLTFSSEDFTIKVVGNELQPTDGAYPITHADDATETTVPIRIRLNDGVNKQTASFTFSGMSDDANVTVQGDTENITLNSNGDANVRWQGNVPLSNNDYAAIVPLKYEWFHDGNNFIPAGSKLNLEFNVTGDNTSWLEVFEICGNTENEWNNPKHQFAELNNSNRYTANGNNTLSLTLSEATFTTILGNFRSDFLGETKIAMAIRGAGITLTKVSVMPAENLPTVAITATPYASSLNYSANAVSDLIVNVTIPAGVTTLNFSSEYFDVGLISSRTKEENNENTRYITGSGPYTVNHQGEGSLTLPFRLRLKETKESPTNSAEFTFSGTGEGLIVQSAVVDNITLAHDANEYVRWQGDVPLEWGANVVQIPLPYSWFEGISAGSKLQVEYVITDINNPEIQFAEVDGEWNKPNEDSYFFPELEVTMDDGGKMGLNLNKNTQPKNIGSQTGIVYTYDLTITQAVLDNIIKMNNRNITLLGESNVVMAIQGGSVILKKISVIPNNQADNDQLDITLDFYLNENRGDNDFSNLALNSSSFYLQATISPEDATKYAGNLVTLVNNFSDNGYQYENSYGAIHWDDSSIDANSSISSNNNATQLSFTVDANTTEYVIEWVFQTGSHYTGYGDIGFIYNISSNTQGHNVTGDTSATIEFTNEPVALWTGERALEWSENYLIVDKQIPTGSVVTLNFTSTGGSFKLHEKTGGANIIALPGINYGNDNNLGIISVNSDQTSYSFNVTNEIKVNGQNINGSLNGLAINGTGVTMTSIVVKYPDGYVEEEEDGEIFNINFDNGSMENLSVVFHQDNGSKGTSDSTGGSLALNISNPGTDNWHAQITRAVSFEQNVTYKLTCKVKSTVSGNMVIWFDDPDNSYAVRVDNSPTVGLTVSDKFVNVEVNITPNQTDQTGRFVINFGLIPKGTIYIDDLKLVKN